MNNNTVSFLPLIKLVHYPAPFMIGKILIQKTSQVLELLKNFFIMIFFKQLCSYSCNTQILHISLGYLDSRGIQSCNTNLNIAESRCSKIILGLNNVIHKLKFCIIFAVQGSPQCRLQRLCNPA